jgi:hypothetical protein
MKISLGKINIPVMRFRWINCLKLQTRALKIKIYCKVFENATALEISKSPKIRLRTQHVNILMLQTIESKWNQSKQKKQPSSALFTYHQKKINGW